MLGWKPRGKYIPSPGCYTVSVSYYTTKGDYKHYLLRAWQFDGTFDDAAFGAGCGAVGFHADGALLVVFVQDSSADGREGSEECFGHGRWSMVDLGVMGKV